MIRSSLTSTRRRSTNMYGGGGLNITFPRLSNGSYNIPLYYMNGETNNRHKDVLKVCFDEIYNDEMTPKKLMKECFLNVDFSPKLYSQDQFGSDHDYFSMPGMFGVVANKYQGFEYIKPLMAITIQQYDMVEYVHVAMRTTQVYPSPNVFRVFLHPDLKATENESKWKLATKLLRNGGLLNHFEGMDVVWEDPETLFERPKMPRFSSRDAEIRTLAHHAKTLL